MTSSSKVQGKEFQAHKNILSASSPYFKTMFGSDFREKNQNTITMDQSISAEVLELILDVIYTCKVPLTTDNVIDVVMAADFLEMDKVVHLCDHFLHDNMTVEKCAEYFQVARTLNLKQPAALSKRYIRSYFIEVRKTQGFKSLDQSSFLEILGAKDLRICRQEIEIFRAMCWWMEDKTLTEAELDAIFTKKGYIRLRNIPKRLLQKEVLPHELMKAGVRHKCVEEALAFHANPYNEPILALEDQENIRGVPCFVATGTRQVQDYSDKNKSPRTRFVFRPIEDDDDRSADVKDVKFNMALEQESLCCVTYGKTFIFIYGVRSGDHQCVFLRYHVTTGEWKKLEPPPLGETCP